MLERLNKILNTLKKDNFIGAELLIPKNDMDKLKEELYQYVDIKSDEVSYSGLTIATGATNVWLLKIDNEWSYYQFE